VPEVEKRLGATERVKVSPLGAFFILKRAAQPIYHIGP
jgi:hypothetical protein